MMNDVEMHGCFIASMVVYQYAIPNLEKGHDNNNHMTWDFAIPPP